MTTAPPRLLLFGAAGQVGAAVAAAAAEAGFAPIALARGDCDIADADAVAEAVAGSRALFAVNAAAYTAVDRAETEAELAFAVNAAAPAYLARRCSREGIPFFHISTDYVFDGLKGSPYLEEDPMAPLGVYGRSKAEGESAVRGALDRHLIIRTSWLYSAHGSNFVKTVMHLAAERDELRIVDDQLGSPTCAADLAGAILTIADRLSTGEAVPWGTYHYCGSGVTSWYGLARHVLEILLSRARMTSFRITPIATAQYPTPARRPPYSVLDCRRIESRFGIARPAWQASVAKTVDRLLAT